MGLQGLSPERDAGRFCSADRGVQGTPGGLTQAQMLLSFVLPQNTHPNPSPSSESTTVEESSQPAGVRRHPSQGADMTSELGHPRLLTKPEGHEQREAGQKERPPTAAESRVQDVPRTPSARPAPYGARAACRWSLRSSLPASPGCRRRTCTFPRPPGWRSRSGGSLMA